MTIAGRAACGLFVLLLAPSLIHAEPWKPARIWVAGSDQSTWVVGASGAQAPALSIVQMWYAGKTGDLFAPKQRQFLPPISGDPVWVGADGDALRILFSDLTACDYFGGRPYSPGAPWKDQCRGRPAAWAGDATGGVFWALVKTDDLLAATTATNPDEENAPEKKEESRLTLLRLRGGVWRRMDTPATAAAGSAFWIASRDAAPRLFWAIKERVFVAELHDGRWESPRLVLTDREVRHGWAGATSEGLVFVAAGPVAGGLFDLHLYQEKEGIWSSAGSAREGNEILTLDPLACGVGIVRGRLCVARPTAGGEVEFGAAALGVAPALRFSAPLSARRDEFTQRPQWEDAVTLGVLLAIMTGVLWFRREEAVRTLRFPVGLAPAAVWKRVAAAAIDLLPAFAMTSPWWMPKYMAFMREHGTDLSSDLRATLASELTFETYATFLAFGGWCCVWEAFAGRTPGKMALGCRVISVQGGKPSVAQSLVRNAVRVLMVSLGASGLLVTLMTILIVTRNRQRLGDLLARTVVVEPGLAPQNDTERREDNSVGPFE